MRVQVLYLEEMDYLRLLEISKKITDSARTGIDSELVHREFGDFLDTHNCKEILGNDLKFCTVSLLMSNLVLITVDRVSVTNCVIGTRHETIK